MSDPRADEPAQGPKRKRNRDFGSVRFTERDRWLLAFVGDQYAISLEQLEQLTGRSHFTAVNLRKRWTSARWVEFRRLTASGPSLLWLTREGVRVAQSPYKQWRPNGALATHIEAVTNVRILLERQLQLGEWRCERELAHDMFSLTQTRPHLPDGLLGTGSGQIAVEVELTLKGRTRLTEIVAEVGQRYSQVWYFAPPRVLRTLAALAQEARQKNIIVHPYPPRPGDLFT
jgi:hypothetical protein